MAFRAAMYPLILTSWVLRNRCLQDACLLFRECACRISRPRSSIRFSGGDMLSFCSARLFRNRLEAFGGFDGHRSLYGTARCNAASKLVAIEGNIGSGKTSCLNFLSSDRRVDLHREPVDAWRNVADTNALKLLYEDPSRWSFLFNQFAMLGRLKLQVQSSACPIKVVERSIYSTHYIFVLNNYRKREMSDLEFKVAEDWFKFFSSSDAFPQIDHFVYLRSSPKACLERIKKRARLEEKGISLEFLENLHALHEGLFSGRKEVLSGRVHVIDASKDLREVEKQIEQTFDGFVQ